MGEQKAIKQSWRKSLNLPSDRKGDLCRVVEDLIKWVSMLKRRASLTLLLHLTRMADAQEYASKIDNTTDPLTRERTHEMAQRAIDSVLYMGSWTDTTWRQLLLLGTPNAKTDALDEELMNTYEQNVDVLPAIPHIVRMNGDGQVYTLAAQQMKTMFHNSLWMPIQTRIKQLCKAFLTLEGANQQYVSCTLKARKARVNNKANATTKAKTKAKHEEMPVIFKMKCRDSLTAYDLQIAIEKGNTSGLHEMAVSFVKEVRSMLGIADGKRLTDKWCQQKSNLVTLIGFNMWYNERARAWGNKRIKLCPVFKVKRHHVGIDRYALANILKGLGLQPGRGEDDLEWLTSLFNLPGRTKLQKEWKGYLCTDGVAVTFVFGKEEEQKDEESPEQEPCEDENEDANDTRRGKLMDIHTLNEELMKSKRIVIGGDPGRVSPIHLATTLPNGKLYQKALSRAVYYHKSGIQHNMRQVEKWNQDSVAMWGTLCKDNGCLRGATVQEVKDYLHAYKAIEGRWWESMWARKRASARFRVYGGKKRTLDTFYESYVAPIRQEFPEHELVVAYGAAKFSPSGFGKLSTPTTECFKACRRHVPTHLQDECRTSKQCCRCHADVEQCWRKASLSFSYPTENEVSCTLVGVQCHGPKVPKDGIYQRGLLFCPKCSKYLNRDVSGALNIRYLFALTQLMHLAVPPAFKRRKNNINAANADKAAVAAPTASYTETNCKIVSHSR